MFTSRASNGFEGSFFALDELNFFLLELLISLKTLLFNTHMYLMSTVEFSQGKQHIFNELIDSLLLKWTPILLQLYRGFMFELSIKQIFPLHSYLR